MFKLLKTHTPNPDNPPAGGFTPSTCKQLLSSHIEVITRICQRAASSQYSNNGHVIAGEGGYSLYLDQGNQVDADALFTQVIDHLAEDDYRRLQEFRGQSAFTTWLTAVISRLAIDIVRSRTGRNRAKERALRHGDLGLQIYDLTVVRGYSAAEASQALSVSFGLTVPTEKVKEIYRELQGRDQRHQSDPEHETAWNEAQQLVVVDRRTPEQQYTTAQSENKRTELLRKLLQGISGEDRLILSLHFGLEDDNPQDHAAIGTLMGIEPGDVARRLKKVLNNCREALLKEGIQFSLLNG